MMEFVNGKDDIPYMKWKIKFMFETTNQGVLSGIFTQLLQMLQMVDLPISKVGIFQLAKITSRVTAFDHSPHL